MVCHLELLLIEKNSCMRRVLVFISLIVLGVLLRASNTIIILVSKNIGTFQTKYFVMEHDSVAPLIDTNTIFGVDAFLYENMVISSSWDKKEECFHITFHISDSTFRQTFSEFTNMKAFTNNNSIIAFPITDTEINCDNDFMDFIILKLPYNNNVYKLFVKNKCIKTDLNNEDLYISYFDEFPRGAGVARKTQLLKVVDNKTKSVFVADKLEGLTDFSYEKRELLFVPSTIQWLDSNTFAYMMMKCIGENKTRLYLYVYDIEKKNRKLIKEMIFPYSIENLRFQLLKDSIYLMNCNGVFSVYEETITQIIKCNGLIDFYID